MPFNHSYYGNPRRFCNGHIWGHGLHLVPTVPLTSVASCFEIIEGLRERTEHLNIFLFSAHVLFLMFCLLVEWECQILVF